MSQVAGSLEIQIFAGMARLQKDMDQAKRVVSSAADAMSKVLGTIGVGVSLAGITSMIKSVVDVGDKLNDLRKITGLTVNELGGLDKQAKLNGTNLDSVAKAIGIMSKNMYTGVDAFKLLGIATKDADGNLRNANQVLLDVADRFSRMQDGAQKSAIANQIFGKSGRELIPLLNEGRGALESAAEAHRKYSGVTQASAEASDLFNDNLTLLSGRVTAIKTSFVGELLPTLNAISTAMLNSGQSTNQFSFAANVVVPVLKGLAIAGAAVAGIFQGVGREIGAAAAQMAAIARFDFNGVAVISKALAEDHKKADAAFDKYVKTILNSDNAVQQANVSQQKMIDLQVQIPNVTDKAAKAIERKTKAYDIEIYKLKQYEDLYKKGRDLTERVATSQERYNNELRELEALRPYITVETYNRALEKAQKELKGTEVQTRQTTDEVSQLWMQAGRNIQSSLANGIFNFFDDGLKGMVKSVASTVGRILSEFAALKLAQSIGLSSMFSMGTGAVAAAGSTGGASLLSNVGSGAGIMSMLKGGASGITSGISGMMSGGGLGAVALPLLGGFALNSMSNAFAGDKTLGNGFTDFMQKIPILGAGWDILAGFFGREPYKFRQQSIQGTASADGFDGDIANVYRSKGGVFSKNKHKSQIEEFSSEQQAIFDAAIGGFYTSARGFVDNLGLSAELVDTFTKEVQIKSEKGKTVTEEAIAEMIAGIGDSLARNVLPNVDDFRNAGETTIQTLSRLSGEFSVLTNAAALLFDKSSGWAQDFVKQFGFGQRSDFLKQAGGADAFAGMVSGFAQNFLTEDQRMKPVIESLLSERDKLGLSGINTRSQYTSAVQSGNLNPDQLLFLLQNQDAINQVFIYLDKFNAAVEETAVVAEKAAIAILSVARDVNDTEQGQRLNASINATTQAIAGLESIAAQLAGTVNSINPLSVDQARAILSSGNPYDPNLNAALSTLSSMGTGGFSSRADFARSKGQNVTAVNSLQSSISTMTMSKQAELAQYEFEKLSLQQALNGAASAYNSAAGFDTGTSYVPKTGLAVIHEGERIINDDQNKDIVSMLSEILTQAKKTADTLVRVTRNGDAMVTA